jgi:uncharacterized protein (TIGR02466 family)
MITHKTAFQAEVFTVPNVGTEEQRLKLLNDIKEIQKVTPSMNDSNYGCYRILEPKLEMEWLFDAIDTTLTESVYYYSTLDATFRDLKRPKNVSITWWVNINSQYSRNVFHTHAVSEFSCVYYLQGTGTGDLRFPNPANILGDCNENSPFTRDFLFTPKDGDLIMFPSWMPHEVDVNMNERERINIAFNMKIRT